MKVLGSTLCELNGPINQVNGHLQLLAYLTALQLALVVTVEDGILL